MGLILKQDISAQLSLDWEKNSCGTEARCLCLYVSVTSQGLSPPCRCNSRLLLHCWLSRLCMCHGLERSWTIGEYFVLSLLSPFSSTSSLLFLIWHPTPVLLPGKSHGQRSLVGCSPWGREELDMTEQLHFHFSLSCIGEGNGNPLQCSCLENPRDGEAWWAAVYGITQSRTRLKWLSSSIISKQIL